jgi:ribosomal protein S18 acetylase RimI-like enzyme
VPDYVPRPCGGAADLALIFDFTRQNIAARLPGRSPWHPGDIAWQLTAIEPRALAANVRLWHDANGLAGVAIYEPPLNVTLDTRADIADVDALIATILEWAEARRRKLLERAREDVPIAYSMLGEHTLATQAADGDSARIAALARLGYMRADRGNVRYRRDLSLPIPDAAIPAGMRLRHVTDADLDERIDLHRDAWSVWGASSANVPAYRLLRASPVYDETLDIVLEDADGRLVSYCICWADAATGVATFEPVGVRPAFAGRGFGRAVIHEGWRRLKAQGMRTALVGTASVNERALRLYPSCGFELVDEEHYYVKELG